VETSGVTRTLQWQYSARQEAARPQWHKLKNWRAKNRKSERVSPLFQQWVSITIYTVFQKKYAPWCLIITLANVDRFSKFFHQVIRKKNSLCTHHKDFHLTCNMLQHYLVKFLKSKNVTDFDNRLLTCSWGHFEELI